MSLRYDKLKDVKTEEKFFDFKCTECGCDGMKKNTFTIKPVRISWKPYGVDNSDLNDGTKIGKEAEMIFNKMRNIAEALEYSTNEIGRTMIYCNKCDSHFTPNRSVRASDMRKWISRNMETFLEL